MSSMTTTERADLVASLTDVVRDLGALGDWIENATTTARDDSYEVEVEISEYENYVDLGDFGEQTQYVNVSTTTEVEVEIEVDVAQLVSDESPVYSYYIDRDALPVIEQALDLVRSLDGTTGSTFGPVESSVEIRAARAALAASVEYLADPAAVGRALTEALRLHVEIDPAASLADLGLVGAADPFGVGYDPRSVDLDSEQSGSVRVVDLRLGDDVTGSGFGRLVRVERVTGSADDPAAGTYRLVLDRDGVESTREERGSTSYYIRPIRLADGRSRAQVASAVSLLDR
jgi:hypothetical protein